MKGLSPIMSHESRVTSFLPHLYSSVCVCGSRMWRFLRTVSGDDAYERYATRHPEGAVLTPGEFYAHRLEEKYSRPNRCC